MIPFKDMIETYQNQIKYMKFFFWFNIIWLVTIVALIIRMMEGYNFVGLLMFMFILRFFVVIGTIRKCEEAGCNVIGKEKYISYKIAVRLGMFKDGNAMKRMNDYFNKKREAQRPDVLLKEFLEGGK